MPAPRKRHLPVAERSGIVVQALRALGHDLRVEVDGVDRGKLRAVSNDWTPRIDVMEGGSNMWLKFEDGSDIPAEQIGTITLHAAVRSAA